MHAGLVFMDHLEARAKQLCMLQGTLARWLLPFDTNTAASEQRSVTSSVLENEPGMYVFMYACVYVFPLSLLIHNHFTSPPSIYRPDLN